MVWVIQLAISATIVFALLACGPLAGVHGTSQTRAQPAPPIVETPGAGNRVNVIESEFKMTLQSAPVSAGQVTFVIKNQGQIPHDFRIRGNGVDQRTALLMPRTGATLTLQLEPGTYEFQCTVEDHPIAGMRGSFTIKATSSN